MPRFHVFAGSNPVASTNRVQTRKSKRQKTSRDEYRRNYIIEMTGSRVRVPPGSIFSSAHRLARDDYGPVAQLVEQDVSSNPCRHGFFLSL